MRIAIMTGIYPPDIGGPATHASDLRDELRQRGHDVTVVTLWEGARTLASNGVVRVPRAWAWPRRAGYIASWLMARRDRLDVVYATGLHVEAVAGARLADLPVLVKIVGDPVWERALRLGHTTAGFERYQASRPPRDARTTSWRVLRNWSLRHASAVLTPSAYLAGVVEHWLDGPADITVIPNGVRVPAPLQGVTTTLDDDALRLIFVGRLVKHKRVDLLIEAVTLTEGWVLEVVGSGPEREALEKSVTSSRITFAGDLDHDEVLKRVATSDALGLASDYEGLPHVVIEALAVGTPVMSPPVGGVPEVVTDGESGLLVEPSPEALGAALARLRDEPSFRESLATGAADAGSWWQMGRTADGVLELIRRARSGRPRLVFVGKSAPPQAAASGEEIENRRRWEILVRRVEPVVVGIGRVGRRWVGTVETVALPDARPRAVGSSLYYAAAPFIGVMRAMTARGASGIVCQSPFEGAGVTALTRLLPRRSRPHVVVEVHGDWRTSSRLYGSAARGVVAPAADRVASWTIRHADHVRVISSFTERLVREEGFHGQLDRYVTFGDLEFFMEPPPSPMPMDARILFVGSLEPTKAVDVLIDAWSIVSSTVPSALLTVVGEGSRRTQLEHQVGKAGIEDSVRFVGRRTRPEVKGLLDASRALVLPSRSEGLGRVILEAAARARPSVGSTAGGIPELIEEGMTGSLVPIGDRDALARAIVDILEDRASAEGMGLAARNMIDSLDPDEAFAAGIDRLARRIQAGPR